MIPRSMDGPVPRFVPLACRGRRSFAAFAVRGHDRSGEFRDRVAAKAMPGLTTPVCCLLIGCEWSGSGA